MSVAFMSLFKKVWNQRMSRQHKWQLKGWWHQFGHDDGIALQDTITIINNIQGMMTRADWRTQRTWFYLSNRASLLFLPPRMTDYTRLIVGDTNRQTRDRREKRSKKNPKKKRTPRSNNSPGDWHPSPSTGIQRRYKVDPGEEKKGREGSCSRQEKYWHYKWNAKDSAMGSMV